MGHQDRLTQQMLGLISHLVHLLASNLSMMGQLWGMTLLEWVAFVKATVCPVVPNFPKDPLLPIPPKNQFHLQAPKLPKGKKNLIIIINHYRLKQALEAAGMISQKNFTESYLNKIMNEVAKSYDIRATIFGTFYRVGFDLHELTP